MIKKFLMLTMLIPTLALAVRDGSGTYTLPTGNPVSSGQVITKDWANNTLNDIALALTDSLSRSGKGGMTAPFSVADGSSSGPTFTFALAPTSGFYRDPSSGDVRVTTSAAERQRWTTAGTQVTGSLSLLKPSGTYTVTLASPVLTADYTLTLPTALPSGPLPVKLDNTGGLSTAKIVASDVADGAVTTAGILNGTISTADLGDYQVSNIKIADYAVENRNMALNAVGSSNIVNGSITASDVDTNSIATVSYVNTQVGGNFTSITSVGRGESRASTTGGGSISFSTKVDNQVVMVFVQSGTSGSATASIDSVVASTGSSYQSGGVNIRGVGLAPYTVATSGTHTLACAAAATLCAVW